MDDLLAHFAAVRVPHGQEQCDCCEGDGQHGSRVCARCTGTGFVRAGSDEPWCPSRSGDQPAPPRRHWRQPKTAAQDYMSHEDVGNLISANDYPAMKRRVKDMPRPDDTGPLEQLKGEIRAAGRITEPLHVVNRKYLDNGQHRWWAAQDLGMGKVPVKHTTIRTTEFYYGARTDRPPMRRQGILHGPDELPPDPGTAPIPEGHVRLWHYTNARNVPSIRATGLERKYARGDSGTGDLSEPSAGVWASTKRPDDVLDDHTSGQAAVVEYHAHPDEISGNAESPWQAQRKGGGYDPDKLKEWASGYHHVIMHGDVKPHQILAIHEGWHGAARYMKHDDPTLKSYQWIHDESNEPWNDHLNPYRRGLEALERERGQQHEGARHQAGQPDEYGMSMRPDPEGDPLHELGRETFPHDIYETMHHYDPGGYNTEHYGTAHLSAIRRARGNPEKRVRIWRAAPAVNPESRNAKRGEINQGDWVTLNRKYAVQDSRGTNEPDERNFLGASHPRRAHIWSATVPAKHVRNAGGDLMEWGYWGPDIKDIPHISEHCSHRNPFTPRAAVMRPGLPNPHTHSDEWFHGTGAHPEELSEHGFTDPMEMDEGAYSQPESETEGTHWNALLGTHFTADHDIAREFALGEHSSGANRRGEDPWRGESRGIVHARLGLRNPKVYASEHDMDHEAYEHEWKAGNHPNTHVPAIGSNDEDERYEAEDMWNTADRLHRQYRNRKIPAGHSEGEHPTRTLWINSHPDKWGIANRFRERLKAQGHDGIVYGNEYERSNHGEQANKSAIVFDPGHIQVTQHHGAYEPHMSAAEGEHQQSRLPGPGQMALPFERAGAAQMLHRGISVEMSPDDITEAYRSGGHLAVHDLIRQHVNANLGEHWSSREDVARGWSHPLTHEPRTVVPSPFYMHVPVVMHGSIAKAHHETDPDKLRAAMVEGHGWQGLTYKDEQETLVKPGAPVRVHHMEASLPDREDWPEHLDESRWENEGLKAWESEPHSWQHIGGAGEHTAAWVPSERIFGPTYGLDHRLFDGEHLKPAVREVLMTRLAGVLAPVLGPDWHALTRVWLAGSQASKWTGPDLEGNGDLDILIGLAHTHARLAAPSLSGLTDAEIEKHLNTILQARFNESHWHPPFDPAGKEYDLTGYVNHVSDIAKIRPYAAYDLTEDDWTVRPPDLPDWSAAQFPQGPAVFQEARALAAQVRAILRLPEPFRTQEASRVWDSLHAGRAHDFSEQGLGWQGTSNVLEKALSQAHGDLVTKLKALKYGAPGTAPVALAHGMTTADLEHAHG